MRSDADPVLPPDVLHELGQGGDFLGSWWTVVGLAVLTAVLVTVAVRRRRPRPGRRRRRVWPAWTAAVTALVLCLAIATNVVVGYMPSVAAARVTLAGWGIGHAHALPHGIPVANAASVATGATQPVTIPAPPELRMGTAPSWVYTPPGYAESADRYPVVYLVHGSPGHAGDWFAAGNVGHAMDTLLAHGLVQPMIVVSVDVNGTGPAARDTECLDSTTGGALVETYLTTVVIPYVDTHLRTVADRTGRAFGGFSSGGYCALDQVLRHTGLYSTLLAMAPYGDPGTGGTAMLATGAEWATHHVTAYAPTIPLPHPVAAFVAVAGADHGQDSRDARTIAAALRQRGQDVVLHVARGDVHTWNMARATLPYALVFASHHLSGA